MSQIKKLGPLVQLIPAVAVAGIVAVTLPNTVPVLADIPERLVMQAEAAEKEEKPEQEEVVEIEPALPYEDGVYVGSSRGYGGTVKVQVTMEGGFITDVQILDASHETAQFLKRARRLLTIVQQEQTWEVDAISEATYTSRGILGAVQNALTGEEVINPRPPKTETPTEPPVVEEFVAPSAYRDGVYTGTAIGFGGDITVQVTIANDTITDISIVSADGETRSYFTRARYVISDMLTKNSPEVDSVSGATYSSTGIINAVKAALRTAAIDAEPTEEVIETPAEESPAEPETPVEEPVVTEPEPAETETETGRKSPFDVVYGWLKDQWDYIANYEHPAPSEEAGAESSASSEAASASSAPAEDASSEVVTEAPASSVVETPAESVPEQPAESVPEQPAESAAETPAEPAPETPVETEQPAPTVVDGSAVDFTLPHVYRDGVYTGTAIGFGGDVIMQVTISGGKLADITVVSAEGETREYFTRARYVISDMLTKGTPQVDAVSGATYSSEGIINAVKNAMAQAIDTSANSVALPLTLQPAVEPEKQEDAE